MTYPGFFESQSAEPLLPGLRVLATSGGDYSTFTAAIADAANWTTLQIAPGTYTYNQEVIPAGKALTGFPGSRDVTILETTNVTNGVTILDCTAGLTRFAHLTLLGGAGVASCVLVDSTGTHFDFNDVHVQFQGSHELQMIGEMDIDQDCRFDLYTQTASLFPRNSLGNRCHISGTFYENGLVTGATIYQSAGFGTRLDIRDVYWEDFGGAGGRFFESSPTVTFLDVFFQAVNGYGANITLGGPISSTAVFEGCHLSVSTLEVVSDTLSIVVRGSYIPNIVDSSATGATWDIDRGTTVRVTGATYTVPGFVDRIEVDRNGGGVCAITAGSLAKHGTKTLTIVSVDEAATPTGWTLTRAGTDTIGNGISTVFTSDGHFSTTTFSRDTTNGIWTTQGGKFIFGQWREINCDPFEAPGNEYIYTDFAPYDCRVVGCEAYYFTKGTSAAGTYVIAFAGAGNNLLAVATENLETITNDTLTSYALTATIANRDLAAGNKYTITVTSNNADLTGMDGGIARVLLVPR